METVMGRSSGTLAFQKPFTGFGVAGSGVPQIAAFDRRYERFARQAGQGQTAWLPRAIDEARRLPTPDARDEALKAIVALFVGVAIGVAISEMLKQ